MSLSVCKFSFKHVLMFCKCIFLNHIGYFKSLLSKRRNRCNSFLMMSLVTSKIDLNSELT